MYEIFSLWLEPVEDELELFDPEDFVLLTGIGSGFSPIPPM